MENLQKAIGILLNPKQFYSNEVKQEAERYCQRVIEEHKTDYAFFFQLLEACSDIYFQFWLLSALETILVQYYPGYPPTLRQQLHEYYFLMLEQKPLVVFTHPQIERKYSLLFILLLKADYPDQWPDAFEKLLSLPNLEVCSKDVGAQIKYTGIV